MTNTPWLERHAYVLRAEPATAPVLRGAHDKALHVSPFQDMDHRHVWAVTDARARRSRSTSRTTAAGGGAATSTRRSRLRRRR